MSSSRQSTWTTYKAWATIITVIYQHLCQPTVNTADSLFPKIKAISSTKAVNEDDEISLQNKQQFNNLTQLNSGQAFWFFLHFMSLTGSNSLGNLLKYNGGVKISCSKHLNDSRV